MSLNKNFKTFTITSLLLSSLLLSACSDSETVNDEKTTPTPTITVDPVPSDPSTPSADDEVDYVSRTVGGVSFEVNKEWVEYDASELSDESVFKGLPGKFYTPLKLEELVFPITGEQEVLIVRESAFDFDTVEYIKSSGRKVGLEKLPTIFDSYVKNFTEINDYTISHTNEPSISFYGIRNNVGSGVDIMYAHGHIVLSNIHEDFLNSITITDDTYENSDAIYPVSKVESESEFLSSFDSFETRKYDKGYVNPLSGVSSKYVSLEGQSGVAYLNLSSKDELQHISLSDGDVLSEGLRGNIGEGFAKRPVLLYNVSEGTTADYVYINSVWDGWSLTLSPISELQEVSGKFTTNVMGHHVLKNDGLAKVVNYDVEGGLKEVFGYDKDGKEFPLVKSSNLFIVPNTIVWVVIETTSNNPINYTVDNPVVLNNLDVDTLESGVNYQIVSVGEQVTIPNLNAADFTVVTLSPVKNNPIQKSTGGKKTTIPAENFLIFLN